MFRLTAALAVIGLANAQTATRPPSFTCMNCKLKDSKSSFLYSYSYCADTDQCLMDEWNYLNQWCKTTWVPGWTLDIKTDCRAQSVQKAYC